MPEFLKLIPPEMAMDRWLAHLPVAVAAESVDITSAYGRIVAEAVTSPDPLPNYPRSTVDGYALRAADTFGASESLPAYLNVAGEIAMGSQPTEKLCAGNAILIHTGGMLPENADAVVMLEYTQSAGQIVEVLRPVAAGENMIRAGEDVQPGEVVIPAGRRLRPQEIGGLAALGKTRILVAVKPRVAILSSGDEILPPERTPLPGQVRDSNSFSLSALVQAAGGEPVRYGIFPDELQALVEAAERAIDTCDMVIFTAGSSASARDLTEKVINQLGEPGVLVHGVGVRPGKPTILAVCQAKPVVGLPGNPVSALVIARLFLKPFIERSLGMPSWQPAPGIPARLMVNMPSQAGREDWVPVRITCGATGLQAEPIFSKSNLIFSLVRADGLVRVPLDATGLAAGEQVWVIPFE